MEVYTRVCLAKLYLHRLSLDSVHSAASFEGHEWSKTYLHTEWERQGRLLVSATFMSSFQLFSCGQLHTGHIREFHGNGGGVSDVSFATLA